MFKLIAEAYEVLSNPDTRLQYDRYGHSGVGSNAAEEEYSNYRRSDKRSRRDPFSHFDENRAFDIFNHFFAEMGTDPFSDPFFSGGGGRGRGNSRRNDPFSDPFFSGLGGFGGFGGFGSGFDDDPFAGFGGNSVSHFSSMSRNGSVMSGTSTSTTTVISGDGTRKTRKETTVIHPDGRKETTVEEFSNDTRNPSNRLGYQQDNPRITSDYQRQSSGHRHSESNRLSDSGARVMENPRSHTSRTGSSRHASDAHTNSRSRSGQRY
jgi:hypothetical protein